MSDALSYLENENGEFAIPCQIKIAEDCTQQGEFFEDKEDAREWVEDECWIFSGDGWFCPKCNIHFMQNLSSHRRDMGQKVDPEKAGDGLDNELVIGLDPL